MRRDRAALEAGEGRRAAERVAQLLIAVAVEFGPDAQRAFVRADPGTKLDALGGKEAALEFAIVGDVEVGAAEAVDDLGERQARSHILIDDVMHGRGAGRDGLAGPHQRVHGIRDAAVAHHVDARDLDDRVGGRIDAGGLDVDDADQGAGATRLMPDG